MKVVFPWLKAEHDWPHLAVSTSTIRIGATDSRCSRQVTVGAGKGLLIVPRPKESTGDRVALVFEKISGRGVPVVHEIDNSIRDVLCR